MIEINIRGVRLELFACLRQAMIGYWIVEFRPKNGVCVYRLTINIDKCEIHDEVHIKFNCLKIHYRTNRISQSF